MNKYIVCFLINDSNNGDWFDGLTTVACEAENAFDAFIHAAMSTVDRQQFQGLKTSARCTYARAYYLLFGQEEVYCSVTVVNTGTGQTEETQPPQSRMATLAAKQAKLTKAIETIKTITEPLPGTEAIDSTGRDVFKGLSYLQGFYEGELQVLATEQHSLQVYHDDRVATGQENQRVADMVVTAARQAYERSNAAAKK